MPQNLTTSGQIPSAELLAPSAASSLYMSTSQQLHDKFHLLVELSTNIVGVLLCINNTGSLLNSSEHRSTVIQTKSVDK